jgi:F-type H+-transporting ATPase subunit delta
MEARHPELAMAYAVSLFELGTAAGAGLRLGRELGEVVDLLDKESRINDFLADPGVEPNGKGEAVRQLLGGRVHPVLMHFLLIILEQGEWRKVGAIAEAYFELAGQRMEHTAAEVTTAMPLTEAQVAALEQVLAVMFKRAVKLHARVDPRVIGGVMTQVGDVIIDGTVSHRLEQIKEALLTV